MLQHCRLSLGSYVLFLAPVACQNATTTNKMTARTVQTQKETVRNSADAEAAACAPKLLGDDGMPKRMAILGVAQAWQNDGSLTITWSTNTEAAGQLLFGNNEQTLDVGAEAKILDSAGTKFAVTLPPSDETSPLYFKISMYNVDGVAAESRLLRVERGFNDAP